MMHSQNGADRPMTLMALVACNPLRGIARIRAGLGWRKDRDFRFRVRPDGIDVGYRTQSAFDLDFGMEAGHAFKVTGNVSAVLARRITGAVCGADSFGLIELDPDEAQRLADAIARVTPTGTDPRMPVLDGYSPCNGVLLPIDGIRKHLRNHPRAIEKGLFAMPHPLQRSAPDAYHLIKQICDEPHKVIAEFILFEVARAQGSCKRLEHIKGSKPLRAKSLSDDEVDAVAQTYAAEIARRKFSTIDEPLINPLPDGTIGIIPLLGQSDDVNVVLLACLIAHGTPGSMRFALEIDEVLPAISRAVLKGVGRNPRDASE